MTFTTAGYYQITYDHATDQFIITSAYSPAPMTYNVTGNVLNPGDTVTNSLGWTEEYVASYDDGIITAYTDIGFTWYYLNTSDADLPVGVPLIANLDPFPVCFVRGTLIATPDGPVPIESLMAGSRVIGAKGIATVKWVGWRRYGRASLLTSIQRAAILPVRVRAHAIADNIPSQDLLVSPWHHLLVEGRLIRAHDLINGTTISQEASATSVDYYHVELEQFDLVMAHGIYSESWADGGNRDFFQNVDVTSLRPEDRVRRRAPRPGFDHLVLRKGKPLQAIQRRVSKRADDLVRAESFPEIAA